MPTKVAVIGAGLAGLSCAAFLRDAGLAVTVWDKGRGPAGRMSTRRAAVPFDHGAQYFTARDPSFQAEIAGWQARGLVERWSARMVAFDETGVASPCATDVARYVGVPGMNAIPQALASGLDVITRVTVTALERQGDTWQVRAAEDELPGRFDVVALTAPPAQTATLLGAHPLAAVARGVPMAPCWAVMTSWADAVDVPFDAAFVNAGPLSWVARDGSKPGRPHPHTWVLHASPDWSARHLEDSPESVIGALLQAFEAVVHCSLPALAFSTAHRWRYALPTAPLDTPCLWDAATGVGVAGDWCGGPRVEGAWLSGRALARRILSETARGH